MATHPKEHQERMAVGEGDESTPTNGGGILPANFAEVVASRHSARCFLPSASTAAARFALSPTDVLVASFPKCGTTWLKSLCFATARRSSHPPLDGGHPLLRRNAHDCVRNIDTLRFLQGGDEDDGEAPRLLGTHLPYSLLPVRATAGDGSGCRIVYVIRDPKDTLVSLWHFNSGVVMTTAGGGDDAKPGAPPPEKAKFEEAFELFCQGRYGLGPQWEHAREYWEASRRRPGSVLCLKYEEMLRDPAGNLRRIAAFMGCPFSEAEEEAGVVRAILELCGMEKQRSLAVNRSAAYVVRGLLTIGNQHFFRKGVAGDWRNHMTPEMAARLDGVVEEALEGSGFSFGDTSS
ncbi:hypothetical protein C2845_PM14G16050 [Panicum miliaceum]|uniref:Sulfotransferase n=1 Tax=Panicum miliaceum TaxID=4540 RepID=A0A3L6PQI7_PANMI|nr:hypothetical protein C2845_PM14G16050 [Panicum miliaceum]